LSNASLSNNAVSNNKARLFHEASPSLAFDYLTIDSQSNYNSLSSRLTYILLYSVKHVNPSHCNRVNCLGNLQLEDSTDIATPTTQSRQEHC